MKASGRSGFKFFPEPFPLTIKPQNAGTDHSQDGPQAGCCGISGSYGFKKEKYQIGMEVGEELFDTIKNSNCEIVTTECGTCQAQIKHGTGKKAYHPVSVIRKLVKNK